MTFQKSTPRFLMSLRNRDVKGSTIGLVQNFGPARFARGAWLLSLER